MRRIVIPGGSGQVGTLLAHHFHSQGDDVTVLSRNPRPAPWRTLQWNYNQPGDWTEALDAADVLINLAGKSVNCRYTRANLDEMLRSRVDSTRALGQAIAQLNHPPKLWLNASTATIYRHSFDRPMDEASGEIGGHEPGVPAYWAFSIKIAVEWERALFEAVTPHTRRIALRSAMIMTPGKGGIFETLLKLVRFGLGGSAGSGRQFVSWIHGQDFIRAVEFLISHENLDGIFNIASPNPLPWSSFMRDLRRAAHMPIGLPAAEWMLRLGTFLIGSDTELILKSRRVIPSRLIENGFGFQFPDWPAAVEELCRPA